MAKRRDSVTALHRQTRMVEAQAANLRANLELKGLKQIEASYKGGIHTRTSEPWPTASGFRFGTSGERQQQISARDRAYQAFDNNPDALTLVQTEADNVIGDGLNYQPTSKDTEWNKEAKERYYKWLDTANVRGQDIYTGCEIERVLWTNSRVAGDVGWVLVSRGPESFIQPVPAENIVTPDNQHGDKSIYDGIRFDSFGRPIAYFVLSQDDRGRRQFEEISARDFVFLPHLTKLNQARGVTCFHTVFDLLSHLDRYVDGVSLAAWMATVFGIVFKQNNAASQLSQLGTLANSKGVQTKAVTLENGMVRYVGTDEEVAQVQAQQPMQQTPDFIRAMQRRIGQAFDMPLELFAKDMSTVNFASARIGLLGFYRSCRIKAARFSSRWSRTIRWWLSRERLRAPGDNKAWVNRFPEDYWNHDLLVNAWDYTDPVSEAQSDLLQLDMKIKSPQMILDERGRDGRQLLLDWMEWLKLTRDMPVVHSTMTRDPMPKPEDEPQDKETQDGNESSNGDTADSNGEYASRGLKGMVRDQPARP